MDVLIICGRRGRYQTLLKNYNNKQNSEKSTPENSEIVLEEDVVLDIHERDVFSDPHIVISSNSPSSPSNNSSHPPSTAIHKTLPGKQLLQVQEDEEEDKAPRMSFDQLLLRARKL